MSGAPLDRIAAFLERLQILLWKRKGLQDLGATCLQDVKTADWSDEVAPFWNAVIQSALSKQGIQGLFKAGWTTIKVCTAVPHWMETLGNAKTCPLPGNLNSEGKRTYGNEQECVLKGCSLRGIFCFGGCSLHKGGEG